MKINSSETFMQKRMFADKFNTNQYGVIKIPTKFTG